jgi:Flp pilus assembly protein TadG
MQKKATGLRNRRRKGSSLVEFAVVAPMLFGWLVGTFSLGNGLSRMVQAGSVCRNANVLVVRGFNMADWDNQRLIVKTAAGLGMNIPGTYSWPNPDGKATVILTKVVKVGLNTCAQGVDNWNGNTASCANYQKYVIASRVIIGNLTRWPSATGSPSSSLNDKGEVSDEHIATVIGNRATGFSDVEGASTIVSLLDDEYAYISEVFVDATDLSVPYLIQMDTIRVRNVS